MSKITYLIGAGASANALPLVDKFEDELKRVIDKITGFMSTYDIHASHPHRENFRLVLKDLTTIQKGCSEHQTFDTYAKNLSLKMGPEFNYEPIDEKYFLAKWGLVLFFDLYRFFYKKVDKRYDLFLATILKNREPRLPNDINIISWNYDYEFERAYKNFIPSHLDIHQVYEELNVVHKSNGNNKSLDQKFGIIKINGTTGYYDNKGKIQLGLGNHDTFGVGTTQDDFTSLNMLINNYISLTRNSKFDSAVSFSWEETEEEKIKKEIDVALLNTNVIVVIGYSFPDFNRKIDKYIIGKFRPLIQGKVYVQDLSPDDKIEYLKQLKYWDEVEFIPIKDISKFYVPHELGDI